MSAVLTSPPRTTVMPSVDKPTRHNRYDGFWYLRMNNLKCKGCGHVMFSAEPDDNHDILVWEEKDDDYLLQIAAQFKRAEMNPKIEEYKASLGPCVDFYDAVKAGRIKGAIGATRGT